VVTAQKPMQPIEKGLPGPGLLAHVAVSKYGDHLPLYRQEGIYQRQGVAVSRKNHVRLDAAVRRALSVRFSSG